MTSTQNQSFDREAIIRGILDGELPAEVLPTEASGPDAELEFLIAALNQMDEEALDDVLHHTGGVPEGLQRATAEVQEMPATLLPASNSAPVGTDSNSGYDDRHNLLAASEVSSIMDPLCSGNDDAQKYRVFSDRVAEALGHLGEGGNECSAFGEEDLSYPQIDGCNSMLPFFDYERIAMILSIRRDGFRLGTPGKLLESNVANDNSHAEIAGSRYKMGPYTIA